MNGALSPMTNGGIFRAESPDGGSTLMTLAPWSASSIAQYGPDRWLVRSRTVRCSSAPAMTECPPLDVHPDDDAIVRLQRHLAAGSDTRMPPLTDSLSAWHDFYYLFGSAAATMVALLFVAASVGSGVFTGQTAPLRVFLSASVVNFGVILGMSLIALAPEQQWLWFGALVLACGGFGLFHS